MHGRNGFTLVELIVIVTLAAPSLGRFSARERVIARTNSLLRVLQYAPGAAVRRGRRIIVCGRTQDGDCTDSTGKWKYGWLVFINQDGAYPPHVDNGDQLLRVRKGGNQAAALVKSNRRYFEFTTRGTAINGTLTVCSPRDDVAAHALIITNVGRVRGTKRTFARTLKTANPSPLRALRPAVYRTLKPVYRTSCAWP